MDVDDLILISVDDHIIEPPDLFVNHLPAKYQDRAPKLVRNDEGYDVWIVRRVRPGDSGAQRGRRAAEGGVRHGAAEPRRGAAWLLRRPRAGEGHGRRRRPRSMNFPSFPTFTARTFFSDDLELSRGAGAGLQRLAHRRVVRRLSGPVHPDGRPCDLGRRADGGRGSPVRRPRAATR